MNKRKRVFVAIKAPYNIQKNVFYFQKEHLNLPVRWMNRSMLHITLVPPWYEDDTETLIKNLYNINAQPFGINFLKVAAGPGKRLRLIWATGRTTYELNELIYNIRIRLGRPDIRKPFLMHMTIARFRKEQISEKVKNLNEKICWMGRVNSFVLMESRLSPEGARYSILEKFAFR